MIGMFQRIHRPSRATGELAAKVAFRHRPQQPLDALIHEVMDAELEQASKTAET